MKAAVQIRQALRPLAQLGSLVDASSPEAIIIHRDVSETKSKGSDVSNPPPRLDPRTEAGLNANPKILNLDKQLSSRIQSIALSAESPQALRQRVAGVYARAQSGGHGEPALSAADTDAHVAGLFLQNYAAVKHALEEVHKRRPDFVPKKVLVVEFGPAIGLIAARSVFNNNQPFESEECVVLSHPSMKQRAAELLGATPPSLKFSSGMDKVKSDFDLIIAHQQLLQPGRDAALLAESHAEKLASKLSTTGMLVFTERGSPLGFEAVAHARESLLRGSNELEVVAPCMHSAECPLRAGLEQRALLRHPGGPNWCRFSQRVMRPKFTIELKKGQYLAQAWEAGRQRGTGGTSLQGGGRPGGRNEESASLSYLAISKKQSISTTPNLGARILRQPMKRHGHVTMEVCTPNNGIQHFTVPRSQGKQAYHDARKADAGDVWNLSAKVRQPRGGISQPLEPELEPPKSLCIDWWTPKANVSAVKGASRSLREKRQDSKLRKQRFDS